MAILYIIDTYPKLTETFIEREICELRKRNLPINVLAFRQGQPDNADPSVPVTYLQSIISPVTWLIFFYFICCHPLTALQLFNECCLPLLSCHFFCQRLKGVILAVNYHQKTRHLPLAHIHSHFAYVTTDIALPLTILNHCSWSVSCHAWDVFAQKEETLKTRTKNCNNIFCCSKSSYSDTKQKTNKNRNKIILMHHGLFLTDYKYSELPGQNRLIAVGRLEPKKGYETLIDACRLLAERGISFNCTIIGDGTLKEELVQQLSNYNLTDRVAIKGSMAHGDIISELCHHDILIAAGCQTSNSDRDGIPNSVLEAMALSRPVIGSNVGGLPEIIDDNKTGLLVTPNTPEQLADAIEKLFSDYSFAGKLARNGREMVLKNFDISTTIQPLYDLLKERIDQAQHE